MQENQENSSYACKPTSGQNKISITTISDPLHDETSELLQKLKQMKSLKKQTSEKKNTIRDKENCSSHNKDGEIQKECSELHNEQNEFALDNVTSDSSSCQSSQEKKKKRVYNITSQNIEGFPKKDSSMMTNKFNFKDNKFVEQNTTKYSPSSIDSMQCPDSPGTMSNKSSASLQRQNLIQKEGSYHSRSSLSKFSHFLLFCHKSILFL